MIEGEKKFKCLAPIGKNKAGKYIEMCYDAMRQLIDNKYVIGSESEKDFIYERNLLISLAYLLGREHHDKVKPCYLIGGEVNKYVFDKTFQNDDTAYDNTWINSTKSKLDFDSTYVTPDFLIHRFKKLSDKNRGGQKLVVEAKSKKSVSQKDFQKDLFKLNVYLTRLKFEKAVYIILNLRKNAIESMVYDYISNGMFWSDKSYDKLYFLIQENEVSKIRTYKVGNNLYELALKNYKKNDRYACKQN